MGNESEVFSGPTYRKVNDVFDQYFASRDNQLSNIKDRIVANRDADGLERLLPLAAIIGESLENGKKENAKESVKLAFRCFEAIANRHPEVRGLLTNSVDLILTVAVEELYSLHRKSILMETARVKSLTAHNNAKAAAVERAKVIAAELWQADNEQEIRLGDMAELVYRALAAEGFADSLPDTADRIKEWIKPVAPDYARKGGRRRKTP